MTSGDAGVERAADKLDEAAQRAADAGGLPEKLARPLADDAAFVRKLKPSLIRARLRGDLPTDRPPASAPPVAPSGPQLARPSRAKGPNPFAVVAAASFAGMVAAKLIDWRSHAHPRR